MRQDWVEFEGKNNNKVLLRPEYISSVIDESKTAGVTRIGYDEHPLLNGTKGLTTFCECAEPYEQVKQKIMDAKKAEVYYYKDCFTKEEYETLRYYAQFYKENNAWDDADDTKLIEKMLDKLNEILKENNE